MPVALITTARAVEAFLFLGTACLRGCASRVLPCSRCRALFQRLVVALVSAGRAIEALFLVGTAYLRGSAGFIGGPLACGRAFLELSIVALIFAGGANWLQITCFCAGIAFFGRFARVGYFPFAIGTTRLENVSVAKSLT